MSSFMRVNNPTLREDTFRSVGVAAESPMTLKGTIGKTALLLAIMVGPFFIGWQIASPFWIIASFLVAIGISFGIYFKREWAMPLGLLYSATIGIGVGGISLIYTQLVQDSAYKNIVPTAVLATFTVLGVMLALYSARIIRVTETFRSVVIGATIAIFLFYIGSFAISFFWPAVYQTPVYASGPIGIIFSIFVIGIAAMNLALDFDLIETGVDAKAPKYMEWYGAFALLVTIVWLYIEILRLLAKLAGRR